MLSDKTNLPQIIDFLNGRLPPEEEARFRQMLHEDEDLQLEVQEYEKMLKGLRQQQHEHLGERISVIRKQLPKLTEDDLIDLEGDPSGAKSRHTKGNLTAIFRNMSRRQWIRTVAAAVVLLVISLAVISSNFSNHSLADEYFKTPSDPRIAGSSTSLTLLQGYEQFYDRQDYQAALSIFESIPEDDVYSDLADYFEAQSYFKLGHYLKARTLLDEMIRSETYPGITDLNQLRWNRMLCDLAMAQPDWARSFSSFPFEGEKDALRKDLNSIWRKIAELLD